MKSYFKHNLKEYKSQIFKNIKNLIISKLVGLETVNHIYTLATWLDPFSW